MSETWYFKLTATHGVLSSFYERKLKLYHGELQIPYYEEGNKTKQNTTVVTEKSYSYFAVVKRKTKVLSENEGFCLTVKIH